MDFEVALVLDGIVCGVGHGGGCFRGANCGGWGGQRTLGAELGAGAPQGQRARPSNKYGTTTDMKGASSLKRVFADCFIWSYLLSK